MKGWYHRRRRAHGKPMPCWEAMYVLQQYLNGELPEADAVHLHAHLDHCLHCGLEYETYEAIRMSLRAGHDVPADAAERLRRFAEQIRETEPHSISPDLDG